MRAVVSALALFVAACEGTLAGGGAGPPPPVVCAPVAERPPLPGAPVPMRRLTAAQIERTIASVLGVRRTLPVADERLYTYRSNIASSVDVGVARSYLDYAEAAVLEMDVSDCTTRACQAWVLDEVGTALFRRPLDASERTRYGALFAEGMAAAGAAEGARWAVQAMMQSPTFLYVDEVVDEGGYLDDRSMATRLALALWGQGPDSALLAQAEAGMLSSPDDVRRVATEMLADPRSAEGLFDFVDQWLRLDRLVDPIARPDLDALGAPTVDAMRREAALMLRALIDRGGNTSDLLTASETVATRELMPIYGDDWLGVSGTIASLDPARRAGILSLPGVQASLAHANSTSPTLRGHAVLAAFLCTPPDPPPAGVSVTLPEPMPGWTTRQRLEAHFSSPACASCHRSMDGIGFAFERYDWLGRSRDEEAGRPIDDTGTFHVAGREVSVRGPIELATELADLSAVSTCIARQWTGYSTGVPESENAECFVRDLGAVAAGDAGLREMILAELSSDWFRRGSEPR